MTTTYIDFEVFASGGGEGCLLFQGTAVTTPAPASSKETYCARQFWKQTVESNTFSDADNWQSFGFYWQTDQATPSADNQVFSVRDSVTGNSLFRFNHRTTGELDVGFELIAAVVAGQWYRIEGKFERSTPGDIRVWVDDVLKVDSSGSFGTDSDDLKLVWTQNINGDAHYLSSYYVISDDGANIHTNDVRFGDYDGIGPYQYTDATSAIPDFGTTLNVGQWDYISELPRNDANLAAYSLTTAGGSKEGGVTCDGGSRAGPLNDSDADGTPLMAKWSWTAKRSGVATIKFYGKWGWIDPSDPGYPTVDDTTTTPSLGNLTAAWQHFVHVTDVSSANIYAKEIQSGFKGDQTFGLSGRDCQVSEIFCSILQLKAVAGNPWLYYQQNAMRRSN